MTEASETRAEDIGWRQFAIRIVDLLRWPAAFLIVVFSLRGPVTSLVEALASALGR
jgi:hypothetical protein